MSNNSIPKVYELSQVSENLEIRSLMPNDLPSQLHQVKMFRVLSKGRGNLDARVILCGDNIYLCMRMDDYDNRFYYIPHEVAEKSYQEWKQSRRKWKKEPTKSELLASIEAQKKKDQEARQKKADRIKREAEEQQKLQEKRKELNSTIDFFISEHCTKISEWEWSSDETHPYLSAKNVHCGDTLFFCNPEDIEEVFHYPTGLTGRDILVVPMFSNDQGPSYTSIEFIDERGEKRLLKGGIVKGSYWLANNQATHPDRPQIIGIAEGVATTLSVMEQTRSKGGKFYSAMNCGNLLAVAKNLRNQYPKTPIVIFADYDMAKGNNSIGIGEIKAQAVAKEVTNCIVRLPPFTAEFRLDFKRRYGKEPTDWNDYYN